MWYFAESIEERAVKDKARVITPDAERAMNGNNAERRPLLGDTRQEEPGREETPWWQTTLRVISDAVMIFSINEHHHSSR